MKNQHTPGPWQFDTSALTGRIDIRKNHANGDSRIIGYVWRDQNGESNANLIAAAPDLLNACKKLIEHLDSLPDDTEKCRHLKMALNNRAGDLMLAAIAKAEGRGE